MQIRKYKKVRINGGKDLLHVAIKIEDYEKGPIQSEKYICLKGSVKK